MWAHALVLMSMVMGLQASPASNDDQPNVLHIGSISGQPAREMKIFQPLVSYVARELQDAGIDDVNLVVASSISEMASLIKHGQVDVYIDSAFPTLAVHRLAGTHTMARRWKRGHEEYHCVLFARRDGDVDSVRDLSGKMLAFENSYSTSGYFLPKATLRQENLKVTPKSSAADGVQPDEIGYVFSEADENTLAWVLRKKVAAGAMDESIYNRLPREQLSEVKIIGETVSVPRHVVSHRADLDSRLVLEIKSILFTMQDSAAGRAALSAFENTTKFDELASDPEQALSALGALTEFVKDELGS